MHSLQEETCIKRSHACTTIGPSAFPPRRSRSPRSGSGPDVGRAEHAPRGEGGAFLSGGQRQRITIAHRLSTIRNANRILVIDDGKLVDSGTHAELMGRPGLYLTLYESLEMTQ